MNISIQVVAMTDGKKCRVKCRLPSFIPIAERFLLYLGISRAMKKKNAE